MGQWKLPPWQWRASVFMSDMKQVVPWGLEFAGVQSVWSQAQGEGELIAVLDTGIDQSHPDLKDQIEGVRDFTGSAYGTDDRQGHGTHTAGTLVAIDNGIGVIGVAPKAKIIVYKCLGDSGEGSNAQVAAAIRQAKKDGATILSASLGSEIPDEGVHEALQDFLAGGGIAVFAAGNRGLIRRRGTVLNTVDYPARWDNLVLAVGAYDEQGNIASFSARGPEVDVMAPGVNIISTWPDGRYAYLDGTSMATPFIAGTVALIQSYRTKMNLPRMANQAEVEREFQALSTVPAGTTYPLVNVKGMFDSIVVPAPPNINDEDSSVAKFGPFNVGGLFAVTVLVSSLNEETTMETDFAACAANEASVALSSASHDALIGELKNRLAAAGVTPEAAASGLLGGRDPANPRFPKINEILSQILDSLLPIFIAKLPELLSKLLSGATS